MESKKTNLCNIANFLVNASSHVILFLRFISELEVKGLNFDIYGPKSIINDLLNKLGQNHFEFEGLGFNFAEGLADPFRSAYNSFLKTIPAVEAIWEENKKKPKLIIADNVAPYPEWIAKKARNPSTCST